MIFIVILIFIDYIFSMKDVLELLIYSLDNELNSDEEKLLENAIDKSPELRAERDRYLKLRKMVAGVESSIPVGFADDVMRKWSSKKHQHSFGNRIVHLFPRVAVAAAIILLVTWSAVYFGGENIMMDTLTGLDDMSPDEAYSLLEY